ncbi:sugar (and other) transporter family protein [Collimonas fungivorans]|uniref:Sugar (And other) transporter family protein n=1 Tax=Collimonas fungivorans TaxID=158899 RepID=A0A127PBN4_9BURK|nr:MFS transporter [Collimonas fungivorans]AMO95229.1 sugar (and other) transporter family protein [Collimonas fungivorans]
MSTSTATQQITAPAAAAEQQTAQQTAMAAATRSPRKAALASWIGSAVEYYDFFIYGTAAALVFGKIFFPSFDPIAGTVAAFATFGVGYVTRPIGAVLLGHIGDRHGRKKVLTFTLLLMGISTFMVGLLPTYGQVGISAPVMLVVLRMLQGVSAAGEQAGANSMTLEHAPPHRRAFFTSFTLSGTQAGLILATLVFLPISALPEEQLLSWGWRIPFFLSAIVVLVGIWVRRTLPETPAFEQEKSHKQTRLPLAVLLREHKKSLARVIFAAQISVVSTIFSVFTLSYAVNTMHIARATMLTVLILANVVALAAIPAFAALSDRIGRKPVFIFGALGSACLIWPYLWCISQANIPLIFVFGLLLSGVVYSAANGVWPSLYGEMFDTRVRLSGMAIGTQIGFALGGFAPTISAAILKPGADGWMPVAVFVSATAVIAAISAATARETYRTPMQELGKA